MDAQDVFRQSALGPYLLEERLDQTALGPIFRARHSATQTPHIIRILTIELPPGSSPYLGAFESIAPQLMALRHPYILPVIDSGRDHGYPYLVYPMVSMRTLGARIAQHGPLDLTITGRYLDQIASALEYLHEHEIAHGSLSNDTILVQPDGRLMIDGFGIQQLLERSAPSAMRRLAARLGATAAPEQVQGEPTSANSDVYALGAVLYQMLTGVPIFSEPNPQRLAQMITMSPPAPLARWRPDLPPELDHILAHALAKSPTQRFAQPGLLANAYQDLTASQSPARAPFAKNGAISRPRPNDKAPQTSSNLDRPSTPPPPPSEMLRMGVPYPEPEQRRSRKPFFAGMAVIIVISVIVVLVRVWTTAAVVPTTGDVTFRDTTQGSSAMVHISATGLTSPPNGSSYMAWMIDTVHEQVTSLGTLQLQDGKWQLDYKDQTGGNLIGLGNQIEITREQGQSLAPLGQRILGGTLPPNALVHIRHVLYSYPETPGKIGLLVGLVGQTQLIQTNAQSLQTAVNSGDSDAQQCTISTMLGIIEGTQAPPPAATCPTAQNGDGFGILGTTTEPNEGYLAGASAHVTLAVTQSDSTDAMRSHATRITAALGNVKTWLTSLDGDLHNALNQPIDSATMQQISTLITNINQGDSSSGKNGAIFAYQEAQAMAELPLTPPATK